MREYYRHLGIKLFILLFSVSAVFIAVAGVLNHKEYVSANSAASSHSRTPITNPNTFDPQCFIDEEFYFESEAESWLSGARTFYEKTGVQLRRLHLDISRNDDITTTNQAVDYCYDYIDKNIKDKDYCIILFSTSNKEIPRENDLSDYVDVDAQFFYGDETSSIFNAEGIEILESCFSYYIDDYRWNELHLAMKDAISALMEKPTDDTWYYILIAVIFIIADVYLIILLVQDYKEEKRREALTILNTPIESLTEKYLNGDEI